MPTFIMLTRVESNGAQSPKSLEELEHKVVEQIQAQCPQVKWLQNYAVLGPYDYLDVFDAPDNEVAAKVSTLIRTYGHAHAEVWPATEWARYKEMIHGMADAKTT
ncbi:GYD domain-containing protein [Nitrosococcus wardiae]|uniref:GYD domain-containing protein n=1 Tax=Nitrosococcus wardiae TaxID=1814290 RepID=A0A4V1AVM3_9GAMM|nr:GYD domain-containing protein [Nitrosococcus wardiae]QBQ53635.1 GYD domain-containing protein [Nitrosococcus wardiae]